ncbi:MAG: Hsp20/alpha crystallin family protein [Candidatus Diapherotrites archaeon]|nr:Hsp20/alpha crystallin family protein [Candidatus Diapherotrites archaeon]
MLNKNRKKLSKKRDFEDLERLMADALNQFFCGMPYLNEIIRSRPFTLGFAMRFGADERTRVRMYARSRKKRRHKHRRAIEALVDVVHYEDSVLVTAFIPGCAEKDIDIRVTSHGVVIRGASPNVRFYKEIPIRARIVPESAKKSFKNGVLEVTIKKADSI